MKQRSKGCKRIISVLLAVMMIVSLVTPAFAEDYTPVIPHAYEQLDFITADTLSNDWQIASGRYTGVIKDDTAIVTGYDGHLFRTRKNIVPADNENEMYVYLGVEPVYYHDWKEIFLGSGMLVNNSNNELVCPPGFTFGPDDDVTTVKNGLNVNSHCSFLTADSKYPLTSHETTVTRKDVFIDNIYLCTDPDFAYTTDTDVGLIRQQNPDKFWHVEDVNMVYSLSQNSAGSFTIVYCAPNATSSVKLSNIWWNGQGRSSDGSNKGNGGDLYFPYEAYHSLLESNRQNFDSMLQRSFPEFVTDPMGEHVEFLGFEYCSTGLDTIECTNNTITWDVSGNNEVTPPTESQYYEQINEDDAYSLDSAFEAVYKIRLHNEDDGFVSWNGSSSTGAGIYPANGTTTLRYYVDDDTSVHYNANFVVPEIRGYLRDIAFKKVDDLGNPVVNAEFVLMHDDICDICDNYVDIDDFTATSDENGNVVFSNVPSGHKYVLVETFAPTGFAPIEPHSITLSNGILTISGDAWNSDNHTIVDLRAMNVNVDKHATDDKLYNTGTSRVTLEVNSDPENTAGCNGSDAYVLDTMGAAYDLQTKSTVTRFDGTERSLDDYNALPKITISTYDKTRFDPAVTSQEIPGEWIYIEETTEELQSGYYGLSGILDYSAEKGALLTEAMVNSNIDVWYKATPGGTPVLVDMSDPRISRVWTVPAAADRFSTQTPGEYIYTVSLDNNVIGEVNVTVSDRLPIVTHSDPVTAANASWTNISMDVAVPKQILAFKPLTADMSGNMLVAMQNTGGRNLIIFKDSGTWAMGYFDTSEYYTGSFWDENLTKQTTYSNYLLVTEEVPEYYFNVNNGTFEYSDGTYLGNSGTSLAATSSPSTWTISSQRLYNNNASRYLYYDNSYYGQGLTLSGSNYSTFYAYVPTTVYEKTASDDTGYYALTGVKSYDIDQGADFSIDSVLANAQIQFRMTQTGTPATVAWDNAKVSYSWDTALNVNVPGVYTLTVSYGGRTVGTVVCNVIGDSSSYSFGGNITESNAAWKYLEGAVAVPHTIYVRNAVNTSYEGDALVGNANAIMYSDSKYPTSVSAYTLKDTNKKTNGVFWNEDLTEQTTYTNYLDSSDPNLPNYLFNTSDQLLKYLGTGNYVSYSSYALNFDTASYASLWQAASGGKMNIKYSDTYVYQNGTSFYPTTSSTSANQMYFYVPTTVYTKEGNSDESCYVALTGTTKYYIGAASDFDPNLFKSMAAVMRKDSATSDAYEIDWSSTDISYAWNKPLDTHTSGSYVLSVYYKDIYLGQIEYIVSGRNPALVTGDSVDAENAEYHNIVIESENVHDFRLAGKTKYTVEVGAPITEDMILRDYKIQLRTSLDGTYSEVSTNLSDIKVTWDKPLNFRKADTYTGTVTVYGVPVGEITVEVKNYVPRYHISDDAEPNMIETVTFNADGTEAYSDLLTGNIMHDGVIYGKYFTYNNTDTAVTLSDGTTLASETFKWYVGKIPTKIIELGYDVYLTGSMEGTRPEGDYNTNESAVLYYKDNDGVSKSLTYPVPSLYWGGATPSYGLYLVNFDGEPIDLNGNVIEPDFVSVFPTKLGDLISDDKCVNFESSISNEELRKILPEGYYLYDNNIEATVRATSGGHNSDESGDDSFVKIDETNDSTLVNEYGVYKDEDGYVQNKENYNKVELLFAVVKGPVIKPDTVVIDYGMPVSVNVLGNDDAGGTITGISTALTEGTEVNHAIYSESRLADKNTTVITLPHGTATLSNGVITYKPTDMQMSEVDTLFYEYTDESGMTLYTTVTVVPATVMYYEDDFVTFNDTTRNTWTTVTGTKDVVEQAQDRPGEYEELAESLDANNVYGYDDANLACTTYSLGSARKVTVGNGDYAANGKAWPSAQFTFTGTAFDVISASGGRTGFVTVYVYQGDAISSTPYDKWIVDTYYGYTRVKNGVMKHEWDYQNEHWRVKNTVLEDLDEVPEFEPLPANESAIDTEKVYVTYEINYEWQPVGSENALYQIPVIKSNVLPYGTYTVVIEPSYSTFFDHNYSVNEDGKKVFEGSYDFYLDAVRTYAPAESYEEYNQKYYNIDGEGWPEFIEIRDNLIEEAATAGTDEISGIVFIDSTPENASATDYRYYGPNNEVYLDPGQSISFSLKTAKNERTVKSVQIGAKRLTGEIPVLTATAGTGENAISSTVQIPGSTDMYYSICDNLSWSTDYDENNNPVTRSEQITITNTSKSASVSLTNIKITYYEEPEEPIMLSMDSSVLSAVVSLSAMQYLNSISKCYHDLDFMVAKKPTKYQTGVLNVVCSDCGEMFEIVLPVLDDANYTVIADVQPTETEDGKIIYKWNSDEYGDVEITVDIPASGEEDIESFWNATEMLRSFIKRLFEFIVNLFKR